MDVRISTKREEALQLLSRDPFANLMTLKMLTIYPESCVVTTAKGEGESWASLTALPTERSHWDSRAYPQSQTVFMLDGNDARLLEPLLARCSFSGAVFKLHDRAFAEALCNQVSCARGMEFLSYTTTDDETLWTDDRLSQVFVRSDLPPAVLPLFAANGYVEEELREHLERGAVWFGVAGSAHDQTAVVAPEVAVTSDSTIEDTVSLCLVFQNYERIWEIGGVYTNEAWRGRGLARTVVRSALRYLLKRSRTPRYQFEAANAASKRVAESVGLTHLLTVSHFVHSID